MPAPTTELWLGIWSYWVGVVFTFVGYSLAWLRQERPPSSWECVGTALVALAWPLIFLWAIATAVCSLVKER